MGPCKSFSLTIVVEQLACKYIFIINLWVGKVLEDMLQLLGPFPNLPLIYLSITNPPLRLLEFKTNIVIEAGQSVRDYLFNSLIY